MKYSGDILSSCFLHKKKPRGNPARHPPEGTRIISAGMVRANQLTNGIANGRFVPKQRKAYVGI
jgi:hypothetical protein